MISIVRRKQTAFNQLFTTELEFSPNLHTEEAGITVFYSGVSSRSFGAIFERTLCVDIIPHLDFYHSDIGLSLCPSNTTIPSYFIPSTPTLEPSNSPRCIFLRTIYANNGTAASVVNLNATVITTNYFSIEVTGPVKLGIQGDNVRYSFGWGVPGATNLTWVGAIDSIWLYSAPPGYGTFKGT